MNANAPPARVDVPQADIPPEYRAVVTALLRHEPRHEVPQELDEDAAGRFSLGSFLKPYRWKISVGLLIVVASTFFANISPLIFAKAIDDGIVAKNFQVLLLLAGIYLATLVLRVVLRSVSTLYIGSLGQEMLYRLRSRVFKHLQRLSYEYHNAEKAGHTLAVLTSDISYLSNLLQDGLIRFLVQLLMLVIITSVLFYMNASLALVLLCTVVPAIVAATFWFKRRSKAKFREARARNASVIAHLRQTLYGIKQIRIFNRARSNVREHEAAVEDYRRANNESSRLTSAYSATTDFIEIAGQIIVILLGYQLVLRQQLTIGEVVAFALFLNRFFAPLEQLALLFRDYQSARAALDKISSLLDTQPAIVEAADAYALPAVNGAIRLENVTFCFNAGHAVLKDVTLDVRAGETVAIVGRTGAGKSTLFKLLTRLVEPDSGVVRIDGHDIRQVTLASLRRQIGVVQQEPFLFHGSLRDNITFGNPHATPAQIEAACRCAGLADVIARLPQGLDSSVHQQGNSLSAGERQLVAICRLFLADPKVVLMDEATSNIDPRTEQAIERAMESLMRNRTTLIISHRLTGVERAHRVVVLDAGQIVETGTHAELIAARGHYAAMVSQSRADAGTQACMRVSPKVVSGRDG